MSRQPFTLTPTRGSIPRRLHSLPPWSPEPDDDTPLSDFDARREQSRKYRRRTFSSEDWTKHRSTQRYVRHILNIPMSRIAQSVVPPVIWVTSVSAAVGFYETALSYGLIPSVLPSLTVADPEISGTASFALSLLLAYRTSSSYRRWDEARRIWGMLLNRSRDLLRQFLIFDGSPTETQVLARWIVSLSYALMWTLRTEHQLVDLLSEELTPPEMAALNESPHKPMFCLQMISRLLTNSEMDSVEQLQLENNLTVFEDIIGGCERIYTTPIPLSYTRHTTRFLIIWLTLLPFAFWQTCGWGIVVVLPLTASLLVGIEEIGVQIEEPFGILPLESLCDKLKRNVGEMIAIDRSCRQLLKGGSLEKKSQISTTNNTSTSL